VIKTDALNDNEASRMELLGANASFYESLENFDLSAMKALWYRGDGVRCIHPGWEAINGYDAVIDSWDQVFRNTGWMRVTPTDVAIWRVGDLALVYCAENITAKHDDEVGVAVTMATNVFRQTDEGWRMILHHASPSPVEVTQAFNGTLQ
jgi:ketosteroid isomerase-like protein